MSVRLANIDGLAVFLQDSIKLLGNLQVCLFFANKN